MTSLSPLVAVDDTIDEAGFVARDDEDGIARDLLRPGIDIDRERLVLAGFDRHDRLVLLKEIGIGRIDHCAVTPQCWRAVFATPGLDRALVAHNHPSGDPRPSARDLAFTRDLAGWLSLGAVGLVDHLIFVSAGHYSFARAGLL